MRDFSPRPGSTSRRRRFTARPTPEALEGRALLSLAASQLLGSTGSSIEYQGYETTSVKLDGNGNMVVGGSFKETVDLDPLRSYPDNRDILTSKHARDAFVAKFNPDGELLWTRTLGAVFVNQNPHHAADDRIAGIAIDGYGDIYASGFATGDVDFGNGIYLSATNANIFVWKLDSADGHTVYANRTTSSSSQSNQALDVTVTPTGDAFVNGFIVTVTNFDGIQLTPSATKQGFVARLNTDGNFLWATTYDAGATQNSFFERATLDKDGNILTTGGSYTGNSQKTDIIILKYNGTTGGLIWSKTIAGPGYDAGSDITSDPNTGEIFTIGRFIGPVDFNPGISTPGDTPNAPISLTSFYVLKLSANGNYQWVRDLGARSGNTSYTTDGIGRPSIALDSLGRVLAAVPFEGVAVVAPGLAIKDGPDGIPGTPDDIIGTGGITFSSQTGPSSIDTMLVRMDPVTNDILDARRVGGSHLDVPTGLATYPGQPVALVGYFINPGGGTARFSTASFVIDLPGNTRPRASSIYMARFSERYASEHSPTDFDGDGLGDLVVYDPMRSEIFIKTSGRNANRRIFGPGALFTRGPNNQSPNTVAPQAVTGDFDGDGLADVSVFLPDLSQFYTLYSDLWNVLSPPANPSQGLVTLTSAQPFYFGPGGRFTGAKFNPIPLAGDIDGDGRDDLIVYDPMSSTFFVLPSAPNPAAKAIQFGPATTSNVPTVPLAADVNGDGREDLIVYRPDTADFYVWLSGATLGQNSGTYQFQFGPTTANNRFRSTPIAGDFDGDGVAEFGVYDPMQSRIYLRNTSVYYQGSARNNIQFGPAPGAHAPAGPTLGVSDLNGDGRDDLIVYNPMKSQSFTLINAPSGGTSATTFGPALNTSNNLHPPTAPPAPAISALNPWYRPSIAAVREAAYFIPPVEATITPLDLTPNATNRRRTTGFRLTTID